MQVPVASTGRVVRRLARSVPDVPGVLHMPTAMPQLAAYCSLENTRSCAAGEPVARLPVVSGEAPIMIAAARAQRALGVLVADDVR
jgi:hypothetical protein